MLLQEMAEVQGFAVNTASHYACPFPNLIVEADRGSKESVAETHWRRMLGNGMSLHCIGAVLMFALSFTVSVAANSGSDADAATAKRRKTMIEEVSSASNALVTAPSL